MKKFYLLSMLTCMAFTATAGEKIYLEGIESDMNLEGWTYGYNPDNTLATIENWDSNLECPFCYFELQYNDKGQIVAELGYQKLNGKYYTQVYTIVYGYNSDGRLDSRTNYNFVDYKYDTKTGRFEEDETGHIPPCQPTFGAVTTYQYREDGQLNKTNVYWDARRNELGSFTEYTYNDEGQLMETNTYEPQGAMKVRIFGDTYQYDDKGRKYEVAHYQLEEATGLMKLNVCEGWGYNEDGSLNYYSNFSSSSRRESPSFKQVFAYTATPLEDAVLPFSHERDDYNISCSPCAVDTRTNYLWSASNNRLELYDTFYYLYSTERPTPQPVGIKDVNASVANAPRMMYSNGQISLGLNAGVDIVTVYDMAGKMVKRQTVTPASPTVDITDLSAGVYTVSSRNAGVMKIRK